MFFTQAAFMKTNSSKSWLMQQHLHSSKGIPVFPLLLYSRNLSWDFIWASLPSSCTAILHNHCTPTAHTHTHTHTNHTCALRYHTYILHVHAHINLTKLFRTGKVLLSKQVKRWFPVEEDESLAKFGLKNESLRDDILQCRRSINKPVSLRVSR